MQCSRAAQHPTPSQACRQQPRHAAPLMRGPAHWATVVTCRLHDQALGLLSAVLAIEGGRCMAHLWPASRRPAACRWCRRPSSCRRWPGPSPAHRCPHGASRWIWAASREAPSQGRPGLSLVCALLAACCCCLQLLAGLGLWANACVSEMRSLAHKAAQAVRGDLALVGQLRPADIAAWASPEPCLRQHQGCELLLHGRKLPVSWQGCAADAHVEYEAAPAPAWQRPPVTDLQGAPRSSRQSG